MFAITYFQFIVLTALVYSKPSNFDDDDDDEPKHKLAKHS